MPIRSRKEAAFIIPLMAILSALIITLGIVRLASVLGAQTRLDYPTQVKNGPNSGAGGLVYTPGTGIDISPANVISVTDAVSQTLWGMASLDFPAIPTSACRDLTLTLAGAQPGDIVAPGWPATLPSGVFGTMLVPVPDTVAVRICNLSGASLDLPPLAYSARVVRSF